MRFGLRILDIWVEHLTSHGNGFWELLVFGLSVSAQKLSPDHWSPMRDQLDIIVHVSVEKLLVPPIQLESINILAVTFNRAHQN